MMQAKMLVMAMMLGVFCGAKASTDAEWTSTINLAGRQRMLSQRMSKEFFLIAKGVDVEARKADLDKWINLFNTTLAGLINGDASQSIIEAPNQRVEDGLRVVLGLWNPFMTLLKDNMDTVRAIDGTVNEAVVKAVAEQNIPVLKTSNAVVGLLVDSAKAAGAATAGLVVDIAGRQRMLIQRMCKEAYLISLGMSVDTNMANLESTARLFDDSHRGIVEGASWAGVPSLTDMCTLQQMREVTDSWSKFKPLVDEILAQESAQAAQDMARELTSELKVFNDPLFGDMVTAVQRFIGNTEGCTEDNVMKSIDRSEWIYLLNNAGKQRFMGQQVSQLYMQIANGADVQTSKVDLTVKLTAAYTQLRSLIEGSKANNIPAPPTQKIANELLFVYKTFNELQALLQNAMTNDLTDALTVSKMAALSREALEMMNSATDHYEDVALEYMPSVPGYLINIAGRQRMLYQKMSKEASLVHYGEDVAGNWERLNATRALFQDVHWKLLLGYPATNGTEADGYRPTPALAKTTEYCMIQQMKLVADKYADLENAALQVATGNKVAFDTMIVANPIAFSAMNTAVGWFAAGGRPAWYEANKNSANPPSEECELLPVSFDDWKVALTEVGNLRALSQKLSAAFVTASFGTTVDQANLKTEIAAFKNSLRKIVYGAGQVPAPRSEKMAEMMFELDSEGAAFEEMLEDGARRLAGSRRLAASADDISVKGMAFLAETEKVMKEYILVASGEDDEVPVDRLNIATSQQMLAQKMYKEALLVRNGAGSSVEDMEATIREFEDNQNALRSGGKGLKEVIPERKELRGQLDIVDSAWSAYKEEVRNLAQPSAANAATTKAKSTLSALEVELDEAAVQFGKLDPYVPPKEPSFPWTTLIFILVGVLVLFVAACACCMAGACSSKKPANSGRSDWGGSPSKTEGSPNKAAPDDVNAVIV